MRIEHIAQGVGAQLLASPSGKEVHIDRVYAGDRMSDLLNEATDTTLVVTNLSHPSLMRPIALMDVPGICLLNGVGPDPAFVQAAREHGAAVLVSPYGMFETCGRLYQVLGAANKVRETC